MSDRAGTGTPFSSGVGHVWIHVDSVKRAIGNSPTGRLTATINDTVASFRAWRTDALSPSRAGTTIVAANVCTYAEGRINLPYAMFALIVVLPSAITINDPSNSTLSSARRLSARLRS
jgi:hypothetical protein